MKTPTEADWQAVLSALDMAPEATTSEVVQKILRREQAARETAQERDKLREALREIDNTLARGDIMPSERTKRCQMLALEALEGKGN